MARYNYAVPSNVTVGATSTQVISGTYNHIILCNTSDESIYLGLQQTALQDKGIYLSASGGTFEFGQFEGTINAICSSGSKVLSIQTGV